MATGSSTPAGAESGVARPSARGRRTRVSRRRVWFERLAPPLLFSIVVLVAWQLAVDVTGVRETILPKPTAVVGALSDQRSLYLDNAWVTLKEILVGFVIALAIGLSLAVVIASSRWAERAIYPWMIASQMVPIPAIAPILVLWFGFGILPKVIVVGLIAFFPLAVNAVDGLTSPQTSMIDLMRTLRASPSRIFWTVRVPAASPFIFSGAKIAVALSTIGAVFARVGSGHPRASDT